MNVAANQRDGQAFGVSSEQAVQDLNGVVVVRRVRGVAVACGAKVRKIVFFSLFPLERLPPFPPLPLPS